MTQPGTETASRNSMPSLAHFASDAVVFDHWLIVQLDEGPDNTTAAASGRASEAKRECQCQKKVASNPRLVCANIRP